MGGGGGGGGGGGRGALSSVMSYRRDWLIGACAYRMQQQESMRLLWVYAY